MQMTSTATLDVLGHRDKGLIETCIRVAVMDFEKCAKQAEKHNLPSMATQFVEQAERSRELLEIFEEHDTVTLSDM